MINVLSKDPSANLGVDPDLSYVNYETFTRNFHVTGGSDALAADLAVHGAPQGKGYARSLATRRKINKTKSDIGVRGRLSFTPSSDTKVRFRPMSPSASAHCRKIRLLHRSDRESDATSNNADNLK